MSGHKPVGRHREKRLTAASVRSFSEAGFYGDGNGLYLKVDRSGAKRWVQRLVVQGKRHDIGLGSASLVTLAEAREAALEQRKLARAGGNPIEAKKRSAAILTFEAAAKQVHALRAPTWKNAKHAAQWLSTLEVHVFPKLGSRRIDTITSDDVLGVLTPIWNSTPETARRVKQRIGTVLEWAMAKGWRNDNPADVAQQVLPKHDRSKIERRRALPYKQVAGAIQRVNNSGASQATKLAFELLVHTASRSVEIREAVWSEFDTENGVWTIPASRMKAKKAHRVPLTARCIAILESAEGLKVENCDLVFPSARGKPLSDMTLSKLMKELGIAAVPHGFRSSFRDWAGEATHHPREVIEFALAHVTKDKAEAAYARSDLFDKRRTLMNDWSTFVIVKQ